MRADRRIYVNADRSKVVEENDSEAAMLLAAEGDDISNEDVKRYGLNKPKAEEKAVPVPAPAESKMQAAPAENKARTIGSAKKPAEDQ